MRTGGATRPGFAVGCGVALVLVTGGLCAGCGDSGSAGRASAGRSASPTPAATTTSPEDLCTRIVAHWSREVLDSQTYGDYQTMGLSNGQYDILREVVDAARAEKKKHGARAADELIGREARAGCRDWYRTGGPSNGPWS
ncbi:hypothetical protein AB0D86_30840 [Streptomyces sp. NPDC048324]|uniref:hypothetical protein n=1 Tax=Streptomyces sp. NPDC048324 TaxID=3157205 RepID=UPI00342CD3A0